MALLNRSSERKTFPPYLSEYVDDVRIVHESINDQLYDLLIDANKNIRKSERRRLRKELNLAIKRIAQGVLGYKEPFTKEDFESVTLSLQSFIGLLDTLYITDTD